MGAGSNFVPEDIAWRTVTRAVDGATLLLDGDERVRLIGVDTPETARPDEFGERHAAGARQFLQRIVQDKKVRLEYDPDVPDESGAAKAYLYLEGGTFLNAEVIRQGYGLANTKDTYRFKHEFSRYQWEAERAKRGLWKQR